MRYTVSVEETSLGETITKTFDTREEAELYREDLGEEIAYFLCNYNGCPTTGIVQISSFSTETMDKTHAERFFNALSDYETDNGWECPFGVLKRACANFVTIDGE